MLPLPGKCAAPPWMEDNHSHKSPSTTYDPEHEMPVETADPCAGSELQDAAASVMDLMNEVTMLVEGHNFAFKELLDEVWYSVTDVQNAVYTWTGIEEGIASLANATYNFTQYLIALEENGPLELAYCDEPQVVRSCKSYRHVPFCIHR